MGFFELSVFVGILRESLKILSKNRLVISTIATISILLNSFLLITNTLSMRSVAEDLVAKETFLILLGPRNPELAHLLVGIKKDLRIILGLELAILIMSLAVSLLFTGATVIASALAYKGNSLTFKDLKSRLARSCMRQFITLFHVALLITGYVILVLAILILLIVFTDPPNVSKATSIAIRIVGLLFWSYLSVVWVLAIVASVIEDSCYGIEALGKASALVKGNRLHGFALNFLLMLPLLIIEPGYKMSMDKKSLWIKIVIKLLLIILYCLVTMFQFVTFTVLYFQCKKAYGEEIEMQGSSMEYTKIPSTPVGFEDAPEPEGC
ncbi:hypothetical protein NMG60_11005778 [Bertholletia excelsa]